MLPAGVMRLLSHRSLDVEVFLTSPLMPTHPLSFTAYAIHSLPALHSSFRLASVLGFPALTFHTRTLYSLVPTAHVLEMYSLELPRVHSRIHP